MEHYHKVGSKGAKPGATTPPQQTGEKVKTDDVLVEMNSASEEAERVGTENHEEIHQTAQGYEQSNGVVLGDWELGFRRHDYDDEAMSHSSSDTREDVSNEGDVGDMETEKEGDPQLREPDGHEAREDAEAENHRYSSAKLKNEAEHSASPKSENGSHAASLKRIDGRLPTPPLEYQTPTRVQRSSVIVTTSRGSPPMTVPPATVKHKAFASDEAPTSCVTLPANLPDLYGSLEGSPQSPAGSYSSTLSGDESGDSETASQKMRATKRVTLRCNRCQEEFLSKMEYLHHLISHQKGDRDEMIPELCTDNHQAIDKLKSSLLIKMEARRRGSICDGINHRFGDVQSNGVAPDDRRSPTCQDNHRHDLAAPCTVCSERFPDSQELRAHMDSCHKKPHCTECGLSFEHKNLLKIHMNSYHSSLDVLQCYYCGKSFDKRGEFVSHVTSHETSLKDPKEMRRKPNSLRRVPSATSTEENPNQGQSDTERSPEIDSVRNNDVLDNNYQATKQDDVSSVEFADPVKSGIDDLRQYVERRFPTTGAFRHHKKESSPTSQEPDDWYHEGKSSYLVGPEAKTRIFIPKGHETFEREGNFSDQRRASMQLESFSPATKVNLDSVERIPSSDVLRRRFSAFSALEVTGRSDDRAKSLLMGLSRARRDGIPLGGPPPLIPVIHPRMSPNFTRQPGVALKNGHQPLSRTASANSALRYHRMPFSTMATKWQESFERVVPPSPVQKSPPVHQEVAARENINNITKEALLHSLSLKRRASAPELGALIRGPNNVGTPAVKNLLEKRPQKFEDPDPLPATSPGRSRQLKEAYQPRRRHPRDFFCHLCGIYFGHKKLLKIHLDCYHGSAQELQCLRCEKNFSSRSEFLEHLMSHEGGDELLAMQRKRLKLSARNSVPLTREGETVIRRELNISVAAQDTAVATETAPRGDLESAGIRGEFRHPLPEELKERVVEENHELPAQQEKPNNDLKDERCITSGKTSSVKTENDEGANFCFVCGQSFTNGKKLEHHISSHAVVDKDGRYCCSLCHKTFDHHRKLEIHTRSHTGFKPHKCELCGRCFPYYSSYYYHKMTHTEDRPHKCGVCGKGFIQTRYLRSHMKTHKDQNGWTSDEELNEQSTEKMDTSEDVSATTSAINETEIKVKTEQMNQSDCSPQRDLEEHDTARILCSFKQGSGAGFCGQSSPKHNESEIEIGSNVVSKVFSGSEDSPSTDRSRDPNSPSTMNPTPERKRSLGATDDEGGGTDCSKNTETLTKAKTETRTTDNDRDSADDRLPKTKRKKYQCKHCHKNFSSYSSLHVHVRIHTGQRPYSCSHCFKKFTHSSGLKRHVRCHTGEKPYPCPACPAAFADRGALKSHIRTHTGERPFICDLCNKTFTQPSSLRVHKKTVHVNEFFDEK